MPGLISLPELQYAKFMDFAGLGITYSKQPYEIPGTNWVMAHGDEGNISQHAGITALVAIINNEKIDFQNAYTEQKAIEDAEEAAVSYVEPLAINNAEEIFPKQLPNEINP